MLCNSVTAVSSRVLLCNSKLQPRAGGMDSSCLKVVCRGRHRLVNGWELQDVRIFHQRLDSANVSRYLQTLCVCARREGAVYLERER